MPFFHIARKRLSNYWNGAECFFLDNSWTFCYFIILLSEFNLWLIFIHNFEALNIWIPTHIRYKYICWSNSCTLTSNCFQMDALSRGELLPKVVESYSRPSRIVRGKDINADLEVCFNFMTEKFHCILITNHTLFPYLKWRHLKFLYTASPS